VVLSTAPQQVRREGEPWPAPRPLAPAPAEVCALNPERLPAALRSWVMDLAERLQVPPDYPAAGMIAMLAGALRRRASVRPYRYDIWAVIPNLWGAIVGRSGVMKSPVLGCSWFPVYPLSGIGDCPAGVHPERWIGQAMS
jgi:putative DNA primase/helicase